MARTRSGGSSRADTLDRTVSTKKREDKTRANKRKKGRPKEKEKEKVDDVCPICKVSVEWQVDALQCEECEAWIHKACLCMSDEEYEDHKASEDDEWYCDCCLLYSNYVISITFLYLSKCLRDVVQSFILFDP